MTARGRPPLGDAPAVTRVRRALENGHASMSDLVIELGLSEGTIKEALGVLREYGELRVVGKAPRAHQVGRAPSLYGLQEQRQAQ